MGTLTQGGTSDCCRWSRPGLWSDAPLGLYREEATSFRFTKVQPPDAAEAGIQHRRRHSGDPNILDSRFHGNDEI